MAQKSRVSLRKVYTGDEESQCEVIEGNCPCGKSADFSCVTSETGKNSMIVMGSSDDVKVKLQCLGCMKKFTAPISILD